MGRCCTSSAAAPDPYAAACDRADGLAQLYEPMARYLHDQTDRSSTAELSYLSAFVRAGGDAAIDHTMWIRRGGTPHATRRR